MAASCSEVANTNVLDENNSNSQINNSQIESNIENGEEEFENTKKKKKQGKPSKFFTEGWVEFLDKKVAKRIAVMLNGQQVGGRRKTPFYDSLWSIKYLHRFKWAHLNERLAYEKAVRDQRMRTEISQVKREANFYMQSVDRSLKLARKRKKGDVEKHDDTGPGQVWVKQKRTDEEMKELQKQRKKQKNSEVGEDSDKTLLKNIFSGGF
ncbi:activator of basal transcription 1-like isoform X2 [Limulus polyphemus]|uniref:Activator of basal transcription 1-like isoform X2 n=1 Tax=Limulus polyphemus TaxID=6850 RepID=A0ABM1TIY0_LIMPO|nr:activator of basal transcription 1-like isoform X2 [Limulus polyphemus]